MKKKQVKNIYDVSDIYKYTELASAYRSVAYDKWFSYTKVRYYEKAEKLYTKFWTLFTEAHPETKGLSMSIHQNKTVVVNK
jgi:hypothetical protein